MMAEVLVPADAEFALRECLLGVGERAGFGAVPVGTRMPATLPNDFIRVRAVGGSETLLVADQHLLTVEAYSVSETRAQRLCAVAVAVAGACARSGVMGGVECYSVRVGGLPANLPDPSTPKHKRFSATISVDLRRSKV